jgi:hypothetical protein
VKDFIPYIVVAILAFIAGLLTFKSCQGPQQPTVTTATDTVDRVKADTVVVYKPKTVYLPKYVYVPDSSKDCIEQLQMCADAYEQQSYDFWKLANLELEARKSLPWGEVKAWFTMPRYVDNPDNPEAAFEFQATLNKSDTTKIEYRYRERSWYDRIGVSAGVGYGAGPLGLGPSVNIQAGYTLYELSDIWR